MRRWAKKPGIRQGSLLPFVYHRINEKNDTRTMCGRSSKGMTDFIEIENPGVGNFCAICRHDRRVCA